MSRSLGVTNGAIGNGMDQENLIRLVQDTIGEEAGKENRFVSEERTFIIEALHGEQSGQYTFAVGPESLFVSFGINQACGGYVLIEIPYEHTKDK